MARRVVAEALGTALLLAAVVGSGIIGDPLAGGNVAIALLANTIAAGAALATLILAFGPVSGAHFNPAVTIAEGWENALPLKDATLGGAVRRWRVHHGSLLVRFFDVIRESAVTLVRAASNTFAGIRPQDVPGFVLAQLAGAIAATLLFRWLVPRPAENSQRVCAHAR